MESSGTGSSSSSSFPWSSSHVAFVRPTGSERWMGVGGVCSMPQLNSTSPLSNSQAVALTSPTRLLESSWQPGVPHRLITHRHPRRAPPRLLHYPHLLPYFSVVFSRDPRRREQRHPFFISMWRMSNVLEDVVPPPPHPQTDGMIVAHTWCVLKGLSGPWRPTCWRRSFGPRWRRVLIYVKR